MKRVRAAAALALIVACGSAQQPPPRKPFGMRTYMFVILKHGPAWTPEQTAETKQLFAGHMANIKAMAKAKQLLIAGPFDDDETKPDALAGMFIFESTDASVVRELLSHDPAIAAGRLAPELHVWYGPKGLTYDGAGAEDLPPKLE